MRQKKAVSEMIAYVLLIVIVLTMSVLVYTWMRKQVPVVSQECEENIALLIDNYNCFNGMLNITVINNGFFNINGFYVRTSNESEGLAINTLDGVTTPTINGQVYFKEKFKIGESFRALFNYTKYGKIVKIEIEPYLVKEKKIILCNNRVVNIKAEDVNCANAG